MIYTRIVTGMDEVIFQRELNEAIDNETREGNEFSDIHFSVCPMAMSPFLDLDQADFYSVTRYSALLTFRHRSNFRSQK